VTCTRQAGPDHNEQEKLFIMAEKQTTNQTPTSQTMALAQRLVDHAENIRNPAASKAMGKDMQTVARLIRKWWVGIHEAITRTGDEDLRAHLTNLVEGE
jgi:hypothetical protein